jgi:2-(1,2-epoxy-1,2-dihydrophenyl)acetyl-CoA isomerase
MRYETIQFAVDPEHQVATLTLDQPNNRNALGARMREEIAHAVNALHAGEDQEVRGVRALILRSSGEAFCAGGDVKAMAGPRMPAAVRHRLRRVHGWMKELIDLEMPVIAVVRGPAYGAGLSLAIAADFILASPEASFCAVFARMGLIPDYGLLHMLPRRVGLQRAKEMVFSTRRYSAEEAKQMGIVYEIIADNALDASAFSLARQFSRASSAAIGLSKALLNRSFETDAPTMFELEALAQATAASTPEHHDAVDRFLAKSPSKFAGFHADSWMPTVVQPV